MSFYLVSGKVARGSVHLRAQEPTQNLGQDVTIRGPAWPCDHYSGQAAFSRSLGY